MTKLSIYLESPEWMPLARSITFESIIIDMPFCSVRPFKPFDWTPELIQTMKDSLSCQYFILNIDGLYSDTELAIIENTIRTLSLDCIFDGFRFQDPGLIQWSSNRFPSQIIQLNMETGAQNHISIQALVDQGVHTIVFNNDTPYSTLKTLAPMTKSAELLVQGPILIQYSRRQFLSDWYESDDSTMVTAAEDPEFKHRPFTFLNTPFGHFMYAHFHRCLAKYHHQLSQLPMQWLIDARGQSKDYLKDSLTLYHSLINQETIDIDHTIDFLTSYCSMPQRPGFFLSNNTDYDWRDYDYQQYINDPIIGSVIHSKKLQTIIIEWHECVEFPIQCIFHNPDHTKTLHIMDAATTIAKQPVMQSNQFDFTIHSWSKGIQKNALITRQMNDS